MTEQLNRADAPSRWAQARAYVLGAAVHAARAARDWRIQSFLPGLAGAGLAAAGLGLRFGVWAGLMAGGAALLWADARL